MSKGGVRGGPKTPGSGRKPGSVNRYTQNLMELCKEKKLDVFEAMVEIALDLESPNRFHSLKELAQYLYSKRSHTEMKVSGDALHLRMDYSSDTLHELANSKKLLEEKKLLADSNPEPKPDTN